eukprot:PhM_4_TR8344/c3_g2_i2/m.17888/K18753/ZFP36L; butyrate response factor
MDPNQPTTSSSSSSLRFIKQRPPRMPPRKSANSRPQQHHHVDPLPASNVFTTDDGQIFELYDAVTSEAVTSTPSLGVLQAMSSSRRILQHLGVAATTAVMTEANVGTDDKDDTSSSNRSATTATTDETTASASSPPMDPAAPKRKKQKKRASKKSSANASPRKEDPATDVPVELQQYKTTMCPNYNSNCALGQKCMFAHGTHEIRTREINVQVVRKLRSRGHERAAVDPNKFKVNMCQNLVRRGRCPCRNLCMFAHDTDELRSVATNREATCHLSSLAYWSQLQPSYATTQPPISPNQYIAATHAPNAGQA